MSAKINYVGVAFYGLLIAIIVLAVIYFLPETVLPDNPLKQLPTYLSSTLPQLNIQQLVTDNWPYITGIGLTTVPLIYGSIKTWISKKKTEAELKATQELQLMQTDKANQEITLLKNKLHEYQEDTTASTLQERINGLLTSNSGLEEQIAKLQLEKAELAKVPGQICEELWAKSGGQVVKEGGQLYRIIEKNTLVVK